MKTTTQPILAKSRHTPITATYHEAATREFQLGAQAVQRVMDAKVADLLAALESILFQSRGGPAPENCFEISRLAQAAITRARGE